MKLGDVVMILKKLDTHIRDDNKEQITIGTIEQFLCDNQVSVVLPSGDIWVGDKKYLKVQETI